MLEIQSPDPWPVEPQSLVGSDLKCVVIFQLPGSKCAQTGKDIQFIGPVVFDGWSDDESSEFRSSGGRPEAQFVVVFQSVIDIKMRMSIQPYLVIDNIIVLSVGIGIHG